MMRALSLDPTPALRMGSRVKGLINKQEKSMSDIDQAITFADLGLCTPILEALSDVGYETPSPIQAGAIPALLEGRDILGQAQTGTGKTAAFALPLLQRVDTTQLHPQLLVLAPTRELAIQVTEACEKWTEQDLKPYVDEILNLFTDKKIMWGSDWPVCNLRTNYLGWYNSATNLTKELSLAERQNIFYNNAKRFYKLKI